MVCIFNHKNNTGFTIVELLIVIVVIGILAAITVVAYSGIQERARVTSVSSALSQVSKKLALYSVDAGSYPDDLATAAITDTGTVTYQYSVNKFVNPQTFCITATIGSTSYSISQNSAPVNGACPGHGSGGAVAITNLVKAPLPTTNYFAQGWFTGTGNGAGTTTRFATGGPGANLPFLRYSITTQPTGGTVGPIVGMGTTTGAVVVPGEAYTLSVWVRVSDTAKRGSVGLRWKTSAGVTIADNEIAATSNNGDWYRLSASGVAPANTAYIESRMLLSGGSGPVGTNIDGTGAMVTKGMGQYNYADGDSPNWVWNGSANTATSTGSPL